MGRVGQGLPILTDAGDIGVLKAKAHGFPEKGFHQAAVTSAEDLAADHLNALQRGMGITADIGFEQGQSGKQKTFDFFEGLETDQLNQAPVDLPQGFFMNQG